jgi:hypothetical protein
MTFDSKLSDETEPSTIRIQAIIVDKTCGSQRSPKFRRWFGRQLINILLATPRSPCSAYGTRSTPNFQFSMIILSRVTKAQAYGVSYQAIRKRSSPTRVNVH